MLNEALSWTRRERSAKIVISHEAQIRTFSYRFHVLHLLMPLFHFESIPSRLCALNFTFSKFLSSLSHLCPQELACLVEEHDFQLFAIIQSCGMFRF